MQMNIAEKYFYSNFEKKQLEMYSEGKLYNSYEFFGAHKINCDGYEAVRFLVWAPHAVSIHLVGEFNSWDEIGYPLKKITRNGVWEISAFNVKVYDSYKYRIVTSNGEILYKADPYAFHSEERPKSASKYFDIENYEWKDSKWRKSLREQDSYSSPISIYEVNLLSWKKKSDGKQYSYKDLGEELIPYVKEMGFTHIEIMPIMEHPYDGSWGYQVTGYFAPTSRFGTPDDFMYFVDCCHQNEIGILLDWVPVHYCKDDHGLYHFDGGCCFESSDAFRAENEQWGTVNFDYGKAEVRNFLVSNAIYWHERYHIDGMRIDAVAYMLYLNFSGKDIRNVYGGYENIEAIDFIRELNSAVFLRYPNTLMMAEESTAWPLVTSPTDVGGLGFNYKWNMGWMNDILEYMEQDPLFRKGNQNALTFSITYAFSENYVLPLSHDEVVHGKKSLLSKMPGSYEEKFANLRLLYTYMYAHPGKKLLFMGGEFGQFIEWNEWQGLDWHLLDYESHEKMREFVKSLNKLYRRESCLYELDTTFDGFEWIEHENHQESILAFERKNSEGEKIIAVFNFTPIERKRYPIGVDEVGNYKIILNSNLVKYGGSSRSMSLYKARKLKIHNKPYAICLTIPALSGVFLKYKGKT